MSFRTQSESQNIFDMASRQLAPKKSEETVLSFPLKEIAEVVSREERPLPPSTQEDIMEHWERCKAMHQELEHQIDALFSNTSLTPSQLAHFLTDKSNFSESQWKSLEEVKKQNSERFLALCRRLPTGGEQAGSRYLKMSAPQSRERRNSHPKREKGRGETGKKPLPRHKWLDVH